MPLPFRSVSGDAGFSLENQQLFLEKFGFFLSRPLDPFTLGH